MDLVEEYLRAVSILLPQTQREDIIAELRDTVLSRIETREADLGRKLTDDETEAVLREIGHPVMVAARYRDGPQHAVGPALYPYWVFAVKAVTLIMGVLALIGGVIHAIVGGNVRLAFDQAIGSWLGLIGFMTLGAWLIEHTGLRIDAFDRWRVRDLRMLDFLAWDWNTLRDSYGGRRAPSPGKPGSPSRPWRAPRPVRPWRGPAAHVGRALGSIAWGVVLMLWWVGALNFGLIGNVGDLRQLGVDPGPLASLDWFGLKDELFLPVLSYCIALILMGSTMMAWPRTLWLHGLFDIAIGAGVMACAAWIWRESALASYLRVDTVANLILRFKQGYAHTGLVPLAPILTVVLASAAFGGLCRALRGVWEMAMPAMITVDAAAGRPRA